MLQNATELFDHRIAVATGPSNVDDEVDLSVGKVESIHHPESMIFMKRTNTGVQRLKCAEDVVD